MKKTANFFDAIANQIELLEGFYALSKELLNETLPQSEVFLCWQRRFEKLATDFKDWYQQRVNSESRYVEIYPNNYDNRNPLKERCNELAAQQLQLGYEIQVDLVSRHFWQPFCEQCGNALHGIDRIQWITHGSLHTEVRDAIRSDTGKTLIRDPLNYSDLNVIS